MPLLRNWTMGVSRFFREDLWQHQIDRPKTLRTYAIRYLRIFAYAAWGYHRDKCYLRASALTFYSLLSFVPVVAMAFAVAKGFGFRKLMERSLLEKFPGHEEVLYQVINSAHSFLESAKGGLIAGVGVVLLFWAVIKVLGHIEGSFNDIWRIRKPRSVGRKFSDYLSMMMICPVLFIMSSSFAIFITTQVRVITEKISLLGMVAPVIFFALDFSPYIIIWILFTFVYIFMPNTKVSFKAALPAGIIAGTSFQLVQYAYLNFQVGVAQYNAIYGSFAALPLFFVWMQISWLVVLFGAELSFSYQHAHADKLVPPEFRMSMAQQRLIALKIAHLLTKKFHRGEKPLPSADISIQLEIPLAFTEKIIAVLCETGMVSAVEMNGSTEIGYQPGQDIGRLTIYRIIEAMDNIGSTHLDVRPPPASDELTQALSAINELIQSAPINKRLKDIS